MGETIDGRLVSTAEMIRSKFTKPPEIVYYDWIKPNYRFFVEAEETEKENEEEDLGRKEIEFRRKVPVGAVIETAEGNIKFKYLSLNYLNKISKKLAITGTNVLKIYCHVSYEAFCQAEEIYRKSKDLETVDQFLSL